PRLFQIRLERAQLLGPELLRPLQPGLQIGHGPGPQGIDAYASIEFRMSFLDQAACLQCPQVSAESRRVEPAGVCQLPRPPGTFPQQLDDPASVGIGQSGQDLVETDRCPQCQPSIFSPLARSASSRDT